jgi:hypothetical protein
MAFVADALSAFATPILSTTRVEIDVKRMTFPFSDMVTRMLHRILSQLKMRSHFDSRQEFEKNGSFVQLTELGTSMTPSQSTSIQDQPKNPAPPGSWSQDPQQLRSDRKYELMMEVYDIFLCFMPVLLIGKIGLVIYASKIDAQHHGNTIDLTSTLTFNLASLNGQVRLRRTSMLISTC